MEDMIAYLTQNFPTIHGCNCCSGVSMLIELHKAVRVVTCCLEVDRKTQMSSSNHTRPSSYSQILCLFFLLWVKRGERVLLNIRNQLCFWDPEEWKSHHAHRHLEVTEERDGATKWMVCHRFNFWLDRGSFCVEFACPPRVLSSGTLASSLIPKTFRLTAHSKMCVLIWSALTVCSSCDRPLMFPLQDVSIGHVLWIKLSCRANSF